MIQRLLLIVCVCVYGGTLSAASIKKEKLYEKIAHLPKQPVIRVEMMADIEGAMVEVRGPHNIYDPKNGKKVESIYQSSAYYMYPTADGLKWGEEFPGIYQLLVVPDSPSTSVVLAGSPFRGMIACYQLEGSVGFVNELSIEDFVDSVLSAHMPQTVTSKEAIAAMAILLRTDALHAIKHPQNKHYWDIRADECGYKGYTAVRRDELFCDATKAARDMVMLCPTQTEAFGVASITEFSKEEIAHKAEECQKLAQEGKDAKAILETLFPQSQITLAKTFLKNKYA